MELYFLFFHTSLYCSVHTSVYSHITQSSNIPGREETGSIPIVIHSAEARGVFTLVHSCLSFHLRVVAHLRSTVWPLVTLMSCLSLQHTSKTHTQSHPKIQYTRRLNMKHPNSYSQSHNSAWALIFIFLLPFYVAVRLWNFLMLHKSLVWTHDTMM